MILTITRQNEKAPFLGEDWDTKGRRGWRLMIFCARATRGLRKPSLDARSGRSISPQMEGAMT